MNRLLPLLVVAAMPGVLPQGPALEPRVVNVRWADVADQVGNHRTVPVFSMSSEDRPPDGVRFTYRELAKVVAEDDRWRQARVSHDAVALNTILGDRFVETDQEGRTRNRSASLRTWSSAGISMLTVDHATVRITDNIATMTGEEIEGTPQNSYRLSFQRVYVRIPPDDWKLISSVQFRTPNAVASK